MGKKHHQPPAPPAPPPAAKPAESLLDLVIKLVAVVIFVVGVLTLASPWVREARRQLPPRGWVCWDVTRSTSSGSQQGSRCEPAVGWHVEHWPGGEQVAVPDVAAPARRHYVSDRF
jgi:hypothetical protein